MAAKSTRVLPEASKRDLLDDFELECVLGQGGFSTVWAATRKSDGEVVAVKQITKYVQPPNSVFTWEQEEELIRREVATLNQVKGHQQIVELISAHEDDQDIFMVFELVLGIELFDQVADSGPLSEKSAQEVLYCVAQALSVCHSKGIIHRDVKPENLMTGCEDGKSFWNLKLIDFGLAMKAPGKEQAGSPGYVAPEVLEGKEYSTPVDMWALGVTAYIILAGFPPWDENNVEKCVKAAKYNFDDAEWASVSDDAKNFVSSCLCLDPAQRLTAADALKHPFLAGVKPKEPSDKVALSQAKKAFLATKKKEDASDSTHSKRSSVMIEKPATKAANKGNDPQITPINDGAKKGCCIIV